MLSYLWSMIYDILLLVIGYKQVKQNSRISYIHPIKMQQKYIITKSMADISEITYNKVNKQLWADNRWLHINIK